MKTSYLFNPFKFIAGGKALLIGWAIILASACIAFQSTTHFDGVIDVHCGLASPFTRFLLEPFIGWALAVIFFYAAALLFSGSAVRLIDIAGTMALARAPLLFAALIDLAMPPARKMGDIRDIHDIGAGVLLISLGIALFSIWMIALTYNAFRVSTNLKGSKGIWVFIGALLAAEIVSQIVFHFIY